MLWISQYSIKEKYHNELNILEDISPLGEGHFQKFPTWKCQMLLILSEAFFFSFFEVYLLPLGSWGCHCLLFDMWNWGTQKDD